MSEFPGQAAKPALFQVTCYQYFSKEVPQHYPDGPAMTPVSQEGPEVMVLMSYPRAWALVRASLQSVFLVNEKSSINFPVPNLMKKAASLNLSVFGP